MRTKLMITLCTALFAAMSFAQENPVKSKKPHLSIGTIGSIGSGKTTLTCAIQIVLSKAGLLDNVVLFEDLDDLPEEREAGITIVPSVINYSTEKVDYTHYDFPGHKDYLFEMTNAKGKLDGAILVVSGKDYEWDEDWKEKKTETVLKLAREAKIKKLVVFFNKCDMVDNVRNLDTMEKEIRALLRHYGYSKKTPVIKGSALGAYNGIKKWEDGVRELLYTCDSWF